MDQHILERALSGLLQRREHHADDPEEDDVVACHEDIGRIEVPELRCIIRPAQCRERPEGGGEPGVKGVRILREMPAAALRAHIRCSAGSDNDFSAVIAVVCRNPVSPPQLSGNAPVLDILQPVRVCFFKMLRHEIQIVGLHDLERCLRHLVHLHKPLRLEHRLDRRVAAVMRSDRVCDRNNLDKQSLLLQILNHRLPGFVAVHSRVLSAETVHGRIIVQDIDLLQMMPLADLEVVRVMSRCNLDTACSELLVHIRIRDHRNHTVCQRELQHLSDQILVPVIVWIHRDRRISEKRLRPGRRDFDKPPFLSHNRILDMPEEAILVYMLDLRVRQGCLALRAPVDDAVSLVDPALLIELHKHGLDSAGAALVHREALSVPVGTAADLLELLQNSGAVLILPLPAVLQKLLAADLMLVDALVLEHVRDLDLGRDGCMIGSRLPQRLVPFHPLPADQNVLHGIVKRMPHVQLPCDIRRRHDDGKWFFVRIHLCVKVSLLQPPVIDPVLHSGRVIGLLKLFRAHLFLLLLKIFIWYSRFRSTSVLLRAHTFADS